MLLFFFFGGGGLGFRGRWCQDEDPVASDESRAYLEARPLRPPSLEMFPLKTNSPFIGIIAPPFIIPTKDFIGVTVPPKP